ncbi:hypothetical protein SDC9_177957 [bioreactor metagenome]|uniref:Uncharacterized protein n=1 Tax=bioreactor metagenome TaxID=1076179 RepID=A0A645GW46_9ZZZZ
MQHAVDAEADDAEVAPRPDVDVGGPLVEGVLPQPVDDMDDMLVVGIVLAVALAEFNQLLEARQPAGHFALGGSLLDRAGKVEEFDQITANVLGIGHHPADVLAQDLAQFALPFAQEGLSGGHHHLARRHLHRQDAETPGVGAGHHFADAGEVDLQRIDVEVVETATRCQPFGQHVERQEFGWCRRGAPLLVGDDDQRMDLVAVQLALDLQRLCRFALDQAIGDGHFEHFR